MVLLGRNVNTGKLYRGSGGKLCRGCCGLPCAICNTLGFPRPSTIKVTLQLSGYPACMTTGGWDYYNEIFSSIDGEYTLSVVDGCDWWCLVQKPGVARYKQYYAYISPTPCDERFIYADTGAPGSLPIDFVRIRYSIMNITGGVVNAHVSVALGTSTMTYDIGGVFVAGAQITKSVSEMTDCVVRGSGTLTKQTTEWNQNILFGID